MTQATLPQFKAEANRLKHFFGKGQERIIADELLDNFEHWTKKEEILEEIKEKTGHYPGNWTGRTSGIRNKLIKIFDLWGRLFELEHNGIMNEEGSAYRIIEVETVEDVGPPEKVMV
jgi:hypothetical protein